MIHEKHCLVILALESEVNPRKKSNFCLCSYDIDDIPLEEHQVTSWKSLKLPWLTAYQNKL